MHTTRNFAASARSFGLTGPAAFRARLSIPSTAWLVRVLEKRSLRRDSWFHMTIRRDDLGVGHPALTSPPSEHDIDLTGSQCANPEPIAMTLPVTWLQIPPPFG